MKVCILETGSCKCRNGHEDSLVECRKDFKIPKKNQVIGQYCNPDPGEKEEQFYLFIPKKSPSPVLDYVVIEFERQGTGDHNRDQDYLEHDIVIIKNSPFMQGKPATGNCRKRKIDRFPK